MKAIFSIPGFLLVLSFTCSTGCNNKQKENAKTSAMNIDTSHNNPQGAPKDSIYFDMRNMALGVTADQINIQLPGDQKKIYGIVMDWDLGEGIATLVSFLPGDASVYLSTGGGFIGGGTHDNVKQSVNAFINKAEKYLADAAKTETTPLPGENGINFYFLTNKGIFVATEHLQNIENNSSKWLDLFEEANKVMSEIRASSEKN